MFATLYLSYYFSTSAHALENVSMPKQKSLSFIKKKNLYIVL